MAGFQSRQSYDTKAYVERLQRSTDPLDYQLDPNYAINCRSCFAPYGPRGAHGAGDAIAKGQQVEVESILRGYAQINTKNNEQQMPLSLGGYRTQMPIDCPDGLETEYTRFSYPAYEIRGLNVPDLNFDYPLFDPQCQIFEDFALNTRNYEKDNFVANWDTPDDQRDLFPARRLGKVKNCSVDLNCNYAPYDW